MDAQMEQLPSRHNISRCPQSQHMNNDQLAILLEHIAALQVIVEDLQDDLTDTKDRLHKSQWILKALWKRHQDHAEELHTTRASLLQSETAVAALEKTVRQQTFRMELPTHDRGHKKLGRRPETKALLIAAAQKLAKEPMEPQDLSAQFQTPPRHKPVTKPPLQEEEDDPSTIHKRVNQDKLNKIVSRISTGLTDAAMEAIETIMSGIRSELTDAAMETIERITTETVEAIENLQVLSQQQTSGCETGRNREEVLTSTQKLKQSISRADALADKLHKLTISPARPISFST